MSPTKPLLVTEAITQLRTYYQTKDPYATELDPRHTSYVLALKDALYATGQYDHESAMRESLRIAGTFVPTPRRRRTVWLTRLLGVIIGIGLLVLFALLTGCAATGTKVPDTDMLQFQRGVTLYQDIVAKYGPPNQMTKHADQTREAWYIYQQGQHSWVNFVPIAAAIAQHTTTENSTAYFVFDAQDRLATYSISQGQNTTGFGFSSGAKQ
jgi:hypothetical protein